MKKPELKRVAKAMTATGYANINALEVTLADGTHTWALWGNSPSGRPFWFIDANTWQTLQATEPAVEAAHR
mgnify:FL=1